MRKALFTLGMIAAAFAGGAVANGQGLAMVQALVRTLANKSDFVKVVDSPPQAATSDAPAPKQEVPAAPLPPLVITPSGSETAPKPDAKPNPPMPEPAKPAELASSAPPAPSPLPSSAIEMPSPMPAPVSEAPPRDPSTATASAPPEIQPPRPPRDESVGRAVLASDGSRGSVSPRAKSGDWSDLRKRMANAGVTRFEVDAELSGKVRFRCVIPVAGRRAVAQMFEGEGVDEFQAAESALKRVQLWRLSEGTASN